MSAGVMDEAGGGDGRGGGLSRSSGEVVEVGGGECVGEAGGGVAEVVGPRLAPGVVGRLPGPSRVGRSVASRGGGGVVWDGEGK